MMKDWLPVPDRFSKVEELKIKLAMAVEALELIDSKICWEINLGNYDHEEVCNMNSDWCEIGNLAGTTIIKLKGQDNG